MCFGVTQGHAASVLCCLSVCVRVSHSWHRDRDFMGHSSALVDSEIYTWMSQWLFKTGPHESELIYLETQWQYLTLLIYNTWHLFIIIWSCLPLLKCDPSYFKCTYTFTDYVMSQKYLDKRQTILTYFHTFEKFQTYFFTSVTPSLSLYLTMMLENFLNIRCMSMHRFWCSPALPLLSFNSVITALISRLLHCITHTAFVVFPDTSANLRWSIDPCSYVWLQYCSSMGPGLSFSLPSSLMWLHTLTLCFHTISFKPC